MRGNYVMLVRFFLFLIIAFPAFSCEKSLEAVRLIDINYVTDIEGIFKKYKVEVEKKVIFGQEILTAKSDSSNAAPPAEEFALAISSSINLLIVSSIIFFFFSLYVSCVRRI